MTTHAKATYDREQVEKLLEALRYIRGDDIAGMDSHLRPEHVAREALAEWERDDNAR